MLVGGQLEERLAQFNLFALLHSPAGQADHRGRLAPGNPQKVRTRRAPGDPVPASSQSLSVRDGPSSDRKVMIGIGQLDWGSPCPTKELLAKAFPDRLRLEGPTIEENGIRDHSRP